jgi:hypothetical protein
MSLKTRPKNVILENKTPEKTSKCYSCLYLEDCKNQGVDIDAEDGCINYVKKEY